eukprot:gene13691-15746_t
MLRFENVRTVQCSRDDLHKEIVNADVVLPLMCRIGTTELALAKKLSMVMQFGVGLEGVDIPNATQAGVWVCKIPSEGTGNAQSCAEHAIFLALSLLRNVSGMKKSLESGGLGNPMGRTLYKSTAIVYGYGGIGKQLVNRLLAFEMNVIVVTKSGLCPESNEGSNNDERETGQNADNMGFVNKDFIAQLKPGVLIVNVARGGMVNYDDVYEALLSGAVGGLGTDVFSPEPFPLDTPILSHPNVIATPHIAGVTEVSYRNMAEKVAENVERIMLGEAPVGAVNDVAD